MKKLVYIVFLALTVYSCRTRTVYMPVETKVLDSVVFHDTTFQEKLIPYKDSVSVADTTSFLRNPYAYSYASFSNGILNHSLGIYPHATVTVKMPYFIEKIRPRLPDCKRNAGIKFCPVYRPLQVSTAIPMSSCSTR